MKKWIVLLFCSFSVLASPKETLSQRLALTEGFSAQFDQQVLSPDGETVMEGKGTVDVARPGLFRWETVEPDENILVSDGQTLWYYSPFIEQVSIYNQQQATEQTPFILLTRNQASDWNAYQVEAEGDVFTLTPITFESNQGRFQITIDAQGKVTRFTVIEQDGQQSRFTFHDVTLQKPPVSRFQFVIPDGVDVDDQR